jgi:hypothetical protein
MELFRGQSERASESSTTETSNTEHLCLIKEVMKLKEIFEKVTKFLITRMRKR